MTELEVLPAGRWPLLGMPWITPRAENPYHVYLARFTGQESARTMGRCLDRMAAIIRPLPAGVPPCPAGYGEEIRWHAMRYPHVTRMRSLLAGGDWSPSHVNKHMAALRGVLRECWRLGLMSAEDYQRARDVRNVKGKRLPAGRNIHGDEVSSLLRLCLADEGPIGIRDAALVAVLQSTGIRRHEAAAALIERYDAAERSLKLTGKGDRERVAYIHPGAVPYLERWLVTVGSRQGPVFRPVDRWQHIGPGKLTARSIGHIVNRRREAAGLRPLSTHDFRRTFIGDFIDAGGDLVQAQQLAGHASPITTSAYDRRPERALRTAVDRLHLPGPEEFTA